MNIPRFILKFLRATNTSVFAEDGLRQKVWVRLVFRDEREAGYWMNDFKASFKKGGCIVDDKGTMDGFVHVLDVNKFKKCLKRKRKITKKIWENTGYSRNGVLGKHSR
ncbi:unnamed protein product [Ectocarpus sp. 4 AP-2014]